MFTHIFVGTDNPVAAKTFYDAVFSALGHGEGNFVYEGRGVAYRSATGSFVATAPRNGEPATFANGGTIGLAAPNADAVTQAHAAGLANGGTCEGEPGERPAFPGSYGAYLRDPAGNKLCLWHVG